MKRLCATRGCAALIPTSQRRCPLHVKAREIQRGTRQERGYTEDYLRLRRRVLERDGWTCRYCGGPATTADHVVPLRHGGANTEDNLVASCIGCNVARSNRSRQSRTAANQ
jgi:5-methylcytosine-specific restriction endonuclease McrA